MSKIINFRVDRAGVSKDYGFVTFETEREAQKLQSEAIEIELEKFEPFTMTDKEFFDPGTLRIGRKGRNLFVLSGNYSLNKNLGDDIVVKFENARKGLNNNYQKVYEGDNGLCTSIEKYLKFYESITKFSNLPYPPPCPFPKNAYFFNNLQVNADDYKGLAASGQYLTKVTFVNADGELFGYKVWSTIK